MAERARIKKAVVDCVDCGEAIALSGKVKVGQIINCPECGAKMQVVSLNPVTVGWAGSERIYADREDQDW